MSTLPGGHDRADRALAVSDASSSGIESKSSAERPWYGVAVHDRDVHEAHRLEGAADDVLGAGARDLDGLVLRDRRGRCSDLVEVVGEAAHEQRVGHDLRAGPA